MVACGYACMVMLSLFHSFPVQNIPPRDPEYAELIFFHVSILEELGEWQEALALLDSKTKDKLLIDRPRITECRGGP